MHLQPDGLHHAILWADLGPHWDSDVPAVVSLSPPAPDELSPPPCVGYPGESDLMSATLHLSTAASQDTHRDNPDVTHSSWSSEGARLCNND